jgi:hypothetical protein
MDGRRVVRVAALVGLAGALIQIGYGFLALLFPYPEITEPAFELVWALVNVGMIAVVVGFVASGAARPRRVALAAGAVAIAGHLVRIAVALVPTSAATDGIIVGTILLTFGGMATIGVCVLRGGTLTGWRAWTPLIVVATGFVAAAFYSIDTVVHFVLLGLLWGPAWLLAVGAVAALATPPAHAGRGGPATAVPVRAPSGR